MNQLVSNYKDKYLKYKKKYLNLKYGGDPKYISPHLRQLDKNFYVDIKEELFLPIFFKDKLVSELELNGYKLSSKEDASIIYLYGQDTYPKKNESETLQEYEKRKHMHETQFKNVHMINMLYGEFKEIITNKVKFHEYFKDNKVIQKYMIPWNSIKKETRDIDLSKVIFNKDELKVLKAENGFKSIGTILVKNKEEIYKHINFYDKNPLISTKLNTFIYAKDWIIENYINQDKIEGRKFFMRVHILVVSIYNHIKVYISNKHPYFIMKKESKNIFLSNDDIDISVGSHLSKYTGGGINDRINKEGHSVMYTFEENPYWPKDLPDGYNINDVSRIDNDIKNIFINIFNDAKLHDLKPDFHSPNGFEMFGCDVSTEDKQVKLHEINRRTGLITEAPFIGDIMKIYKHEDNFKNLTRII